ncbi:uncharacterized protein EV422DRAFT_305975 [Fimicolochytrium jonesii]|uniref:uncharacterized protein n=1 Tax=Fimicolochytrium jonesii TaxID=1396493 RepID=UPI0022FE4F34|nr:uncharacterized protein EV422DRAFT_305975 [Fimicolochytrium jonesii]KAI8824084.1 hypothetical protein EV422DRAFT_305975 [Fimicolochytrium jonesii]
MGPGFDPTGTLSAVSPTDQNSQSDISFSVNGQRGSLPLPTLPSMNKRLDGVHSNLTPHPYLSNSYQLPLSTIDYHPQQQPRVGSRPSVDLLLIQPPPLQLSNHSSLRTLSDTSHEPANSRTGSSLQQQPSLAAEAAPEEPAEGTMSSQLKREEQRIDLKVLHHLNKDNNRQKQKRFKRTVTAVHSIVTHKLYKSKASSLETYFRDAWKISRAQVYRFLDCAIILKVLAKSLMSAHHWPYRFISTDHCSPVHSNCKTSRNSRRANDFAAR